MFWKRCVLISTILLTLVSGFAQADENKKFITYGLYVSNWGMELVVKPYDGTTSYFSATTLSNSQLFGDPPNLSFNDSPLNFMTLMLTPEISEKLRELDSQYGEDTERRLYIGAAGFDKASEQVVNETLKKAIDNSRLNQVLGINVNDALTKAGCYEAEQKATFQLCAMHWAIKHRTGIDFKHDNTYMESDRELMAELAIDLSHQHKLQSQQHFLLQATSYIQPGALIKNDLQETPEWMGSSKHWWEPFNLSRAGSTHQLGYLYSNEQVQNSTDALNLYIQARIQSRINAGEHFYLGTVADNANGIADRMRTFRANSNAGAMLLKIAETRNGLTAPAGSSITEEQLAEAQHQARKLAQQAHDTGGLAMALFLGAMQPSIEEGSHVMIVGELANFFVDYQGETLYTLFGDLAANEKKLSQAYSSYQYTLTPEVLEKFDSIQKNPRKKSDLQVGMSKAEFKNWLENLQNSIHNKVLSIPESEYADALMRACQERYSAI